MYKFYILSFLLILANSHLLKAQKIELIQDGKPSSVRGLSVVDNHIAWLSGSKGYIAKTIDGGKNWNWQQVKGYEQADFRDVEAFSDKEAIIMSSGTPALILKTTDGGITWQLKYQNNDKAYFLDAMDFTGKKHGLILGDPIENKFLMLETNDAGETWHTFASPPDAVPGEAAFAASGTCLRIAGNKINVVTGGTVARILSMSSNKKWEGYTLPIAHGQSSKGAFSISNGLVNIVGGNYVKIKNTDSVACFLNNRHFTQSDKGPAGFQSCVEYINNKTLLSTGTSGTNISTDGGRTWQQIDASSFNVCIKAKNGNLVLLAGDKGKTGILNP